MTKWNKAKVAAAAVAAGGMQLSNAAVDVAGITAAGADVATVGAAVFLVYIGVKVYHWVRRAL
jgi:hypothetical protein